LNDGSALGTAKSLLLSIIIAPIYAGIFVIPLGTVAAAASWPVIARFDERRTVAALTILVGYGLLLGAALALALFSAISAISNIQTHAPELTVIGGWGAAFGALSAAVWWVLIPVRDKAT
jgi:predicted PurR-regulated permease PerM